VHVKIGNVQVEPLYDGHGVIPAVDFFKRMPPDAWSDHAEYLTEDGNWDFPIGGYLVRSRDRVVLIDTGFGPRTGTIMQGGQLLKSLALLGVTPADVTDVLLTHLHTDHIGWAWHHGQVTFPSATYRCHADDWSYFVGGPGESLLEPAARPAPGYADERIAWIDILHGISDRLELWTTEGTIFDGIDLVMAPGHTPGSTVVVVSSGAERGIIVGDAVHCPAQLTDTEWGVFGDVDPAAAAAARERLVRELEGTPHYIAGPHFPGMRFGRVLMSAGQRRWRIP
jgi:glyoxylase-like metal-dependent hydrolase (beta-lactamase superfamily II)